MAITVNSKGMANARGLIAAGKINEGAWSFSAADGDQLLGDDDWSEYGRWFLAVDSAADPETKDHYKYPFGKGGEIYRRGMISAKSRAAQQKLTAVADAADALLQAIDKKIEKKGLAPEIERRFRPIQEMRLQRSEDGKMFIEGHPIVFDQYAEIWPGFLEIIRAGSAAPALEARNTLVLWQHLPENPMAGFKNGTLEASEDKTGVFMRADVSGTVWGRDGYEAIESKLVDQMSFAFRVDPLGESWHKEEIDGKIYDVREITLFSALPDFSPVSYPAYEGTDVQARAMELALRNRPKPEASGDAAGAAALQVRKDARANLELMRESLKQEETL